MTETRKQSGSRRKWVVVGLLAVLFLVGGGLYAWLGPTAQAQPPQPLLFSHQKHVKAGIQCVFCHSGVLNGPVAGIPSLGKCMGCHNNIQIKDESFQPEVDKLVQAWKAGQPLRWVKVNDQPDFVYFSHRPHILNGVSCERCHGNVSQMDLVKPVHDINMGFCLDCHRQQAPEKVERLVECKTCHK